MPLQTAPKWLPAPEPCRSPPSPAALRLNWGHLPKAHWNSLSGRRSCRLLAQAALPIAARPERFENRPVLPYPRSRTCNPTKRYRYIRPRPRVAESLSASRPLHPPANCTGYRPTDRRVFASVPPLRSLRRCQPPEALQRIALASPFACKHVVAFSSNPPSTLIRHNLRAIYFLRSGSPAKK